MRRLISLTVSVSVLVFISSCADLVDIRWERMQAAEHGEALEEDLDPPPAPPSFVRWGLSDNGESSIVSNASSAELSGMLTIVVYDPKPAHCPTNNRVQVTEDSFACLTAHELTSEEIDRLRTPAPELVEISDLSRP